MMILQGVGHPVPYLGVSYENDPKKGGYMAHAPALDLTTLFKVISIFELLGLENCNEQVMP